MQHARAPGIVIFEGDEVWRINRAQVAILLGIRPQEVDEMPEQDVSDVLAVKTANDQIEAERSVKRAARMRRSRG